MKFCCYTKYNNRKRKCIKCKKPLSKCTNKNLLEKLPNDILQYILKLYLKSKNMFCYSNLMLVSKTFNNNFNILYKTFKYISYKNLYNLNKSVYYVKSTHFNIKFAKLYFHKTQYKFNLLLGEENMVLATHKNHNRVCNRLNEMYNLPYFTFIFI